MKLRYKGETISLLWSFVIVLVISLVVFQISPIFLLVSLCLSLIYIILSQKQLMGNSILVTHNQFPDINIIAEEVALKLNIKRPKIFIYQDPYLNAYTIGFTRPYAIMITSSLLDVLSKDELIFVLGHEMGHIKYGHSKYLSFISPIGSNIPFISWLYGDWQRRSEYTADRTGFYAVAKIRPTVTAMVKLAVGDKLSKLIDIDELLEQIEESQKGIIAKAGEFLLNHPYITNRIYALSIFYKFKE